MSAPLQVLKKSVVAAKGQIEHTKSERSILCEIRHPFIVRLRFAFQSAEKLYIVTDYYNSGTLFYHLRKSGKFSVARAKFYACELLSALDHLHQQSIIYRDLKLENILMGHTGHIGNLYILFVFACTFILTFFIDSSHGFRSIQTRDRCQWWRHDVLRNG
jgi:serine/threonine protein kinase